MEESFIRKQSLKTDKLEYPSHIYFLFLLFSFYLAIPIVDIPLLGLSLSAPVLFLIALPVFLKPPCPWLGRYRGWIVLVIFIWLGIFTSTMLNGVISGGTRVDKDSIISLIRFAYWFLAFVITLYLVSSQHDFAKKVVNILAVGIALLGLARLGEAVFGGAIGFWMHLRIMTENGYGIQFSTFFPFLLVLLFDEKHRKIAFVAALALLFAIAMNGSRSSWIAVLAGTLVFLWIYLRGDAHRVRVVAVLFFLIGAFILGSLLAPKDAIFLFKQRFSTFEKLDADKSYAIRQLMVQKGLRLFKASPWIGVGIARWRKESIPLDLPRVLRYAPQSHFDIKSPHNSYVSFLAENGLAGALPYALLLGILAFRGYKAAVSLSKRGEIWAVGIYASFIGMSIHLWTLAGLTSTAPWFVYGLVAAVIVLEQRTSFSEREILHYAPRFSLPRPRHH